MKKKKLQRLLIFAAVAAGVGLLFHRGQRWRGVSPTQVLFTGHSGWDLTLQDNWLIAAGKNKISGWNTAREEKLFEFEVTAPIGSVTAGQQGRFYVLDESGGLLAFDSRGEPIAARPAESGVIEALSFRNGRLLVADATGGLLWLDPITLATLEVAPGSGAVELIDCLDGVTCSGSFGAEVVRVVEDGEQWNVPISRVGGLSISADAKWIGVVTWRGELYLIDRAKRKIAWRNEVGWTGQIKTVRFDPGSQLVVTCSPIAGRIWVFDCNTGESVMESAVGGDPIDADFVSSTEVVALHADGDLRWWPLEHRKNQ